MYCIIFSQLCYKVISIDGQSSQSVCVMVETLYPTRACHMLCRAYSYKMIARLIYMGIWLTSLQVDRVSYAAHPKGLLVTSLHFWIPIMPKYTCPISICNWYRWFMLFLIQGFHSVFLSTRMCVEQILGPRLIRWL